MNDLCPIWNTEASVEQQGDATLEIFNSPRAGGRYALSRRAKTLMSRDVETFDNRFKARLTSWLVDQRALGYEYPKITDVSLRELETRKGLSVHERADRLLISGISLLSKNWARRRVGRAEYVHEPLGTFGVRGPHRIALPTELPSQRALDWKRCPGESLNHSPRLCSTRET